MARHLVWFRRDLRIADNTALHAACTPAPTGGVVGVFLVSPGEWEAHSVAPVQIEFMLRTLRVLSDDLASHRIPLLVALSARPADIPRVLLDLAHARGVTGLFFNREYELNESRRDSAVSEAFEKAGIACSTHDDQVILRPGSVLTQDHRPYTVFTPFMKQWISTLNQQGGVRVFKSPAPQATIDIQPSQIPARVEGFATNVAPSLWPAGEHEAMRRLRRFTSVLLDRYAADRDAPALEATSVLSPYLAVGSISPRQCVRAALDANATALVTSASGASRWVTELVWREFYVHVLHAFPRVCMGRAFKLATERVRWRDAPADFDRWCHGQTGFPIVDAAMRQLRTTGWMHNRLRMVSAMFLTKNLLIDWRLGEEFFMRHLVDGFFASNNGGWQWSASTGTDAVPYFRIFNPLSQSKTHDPDGEFIRRYVPELASLDADAIHEPPELTRSHLGYPTAIVDLSQSRRRVMEAFSALNPR